MPRGVYIFSSSGTNSRGLVRLGRLFRFAGPHVFDDPGTGSADNPQDDTHYTRESHPYGCSKDLPVYDTAKDGYGAGEESDVLPNLSDDSKYFVCQLFRLRFRPVQRPVLMVFKSGDLSPMYIEPPDQDTARQAGSAAGERYYSDEGAFSG